jgi:ferredoxin-NADP reductase
MAGTAVSGRLTWRVATLKEARTESATARTLVLDVPDWPGHRPGQHVDLKLTAPDGYSTERSYSIASAWTGSGPVELTVQRVDDGEVSTYLADSFEVGYPLELRGPVGGWFVWRETSAAPVLLIGGGSGVVPLMSMIRQRGAVRGRQPFRLIYSVRTPDDVIYGPELARHVRDDPGLDVTYVYTRRTPDLWPDKPKRLGLATINTHGWPPEFHPDVYVCGPTSFVEAVSDVLVALGHNPRTIRTERFGGTP